MKNYEKIQSMSLEELAEVVRPCTIDPEIQPGDCGGKTCIECSMKWLQQENED